MASRRCRSCRVSYPNVKGKVECPECGTALIFQTFVSADTDWPVEIKSKLDPLDDDTRQEIVTGWASLKAEAELRGDRWSLADCIEDYPHREPAS